MTRIIADLRGLLFPAEIADFSQNPAERMFNHRVHRGLQRVVYGYWLLAVSFWLLAVSFACRPKPGTRNSEPETRNPEPETRNPEPITNNIHHQSVPAEPWSRPRPRSQPDFSCHECTNVDLRYTSFVHLVRHEACVYS
jgi:hypothetical protein